MKQRTTIFKKVLFRAILCSSLLLFTFCDNSEDEVNLQPVNLITKNAKVTELIIQLANININNRAISSKNSQSSLPECTGFKYPVTFDAYYGDNPTPQQITVNSDEELLNFFNTTLTPGNSYYIIFPVILIDATGEETVINSVEELEGTIQTALDVCNGDSDDDDSDDGDNDDSDDGDNDDEDSDDDNDSDDDHDSDDGDDNDDSDDDNDNDDSDDEDDDNDDDDSDNDDDSDDDEYEYCHRNNKKVYICHKGITICVSVNAIWGHLNQHEEDYLGRCD